MKKKWTGTLLTGKNGKKVKVEKNKEKK